MSLDELVPDQGEIAVSLLETEDGELAVEGYAVREGGFEKGELRDVYLQAFSNERGGEEKDGKTLSAYLKGQVSQISKDLEGFLIQQESLELEAGVGETA